MLTLNRVSSITEIKQTSILAAEIWHEHFTPIIGKQQVEYMLDKFQSEHAISEQIRQGYSYFALMNDDQQIGYTGIKTEPDCLFLSKLYIRKDFRGRGYSKVMLDQIKKEARQNKKNIIRLTCNKNNANSLAVYKKLGFRIVQEEKNDIGNGFYMDDYILEKQL